MLSTSFDFILSSRSYLKNKEKVEQHLCLSASLRAAVHVADDFSFAGLLGLKGRPNCVVSRHFAAHSFHRRTRNSGCKNKSLLSRY